MKIKAVIHTNYDFSLPIYSPEFDAEAYIIEANVDSLADYVRFCRDNCHIISEVFTNFIHDFWTAAIEYFTGCDGEFVFGDYSIELNVVN